MCIVSESRVREGLNEAAQNALHQLLDVEEHSATAAQLQSLLLTSTPIVVPAPEPVPTQLSAATLMGRPFSDYPSLLDQCIGPPLRLGREPVLGYVSALCALSALRNKDPHAALAALFLTTLSASHLQRPVLETLHHLLLETGVDGSLGLLSLPAWRAGTTPADMSALRHRYQLRLVTTAVQINGAFTAEADEAGPPHR